MGPPPYTARPIWEITVSSWLGYGWRWWASTDTPKNRTPKITPIQRIVVAALCDFGRRKAGTPLEMASTPVRATAPEENPFRRRNSPRLPPVTAVAIDLWGSKGTGLMWPKNDRNRPYPTSKAMLTM